MGAGGVVGGGGGMGGGGNQTPMLHPVALINKRNMYGIGKVRENSFRFELQFEASHIPIHKYDMTDNHKKWFT